jgi:hypothetical protein
MPSLKKISTFRVTSQFSHQNTRRLTNGVLKLQEKRVRKERVRKIGTWIFLVAQLAFLIFFWVVSIDSYKFGAYLCALLFMLNCLIFLISLTITNAIIKPKRDPGIVIWWLCCLRVGNSKSFI